MTSILSQVPVCAVLLLAVAPTAARGGVDCGAQSAGTCADCPGGHWWCFGDCEWFGSTETDHRGQCKPLGPFKGWTDLDADHRFLDYSATDFCMGPNRVGETHMAHLFCWSYTDEDISDEAPIWGNNTVGYKHNSDLGFAAFHADIGCPEGKYALFKITCVETPDLFPKTDGPAGSTTDEYTVNKASDDPEEFGAFTIAHIQTDQVAHCKEEHDGYCAEECSNFKAGGKSLFKLVHARDYIDVHGNGFGSHPYRSDSNVDNMVIHHGLIKHQFVGYVNITCVPDPVANFSGSTRNGMTTFDAPTNQPDKGTFILELIPECFAPMKHAAGQPWTIEYIPGCDCKHEPNQCPTVEPTSAPTLAPTDEASSSGKLPGSAQYSTSGSDGSSVVTNPGAAGEEETDSNMGMIIGIILGVLCLLGILVAAFIISRRNSAGASAFEQEATMLGMPDMNKDLHKKDKDDENSSDISAPVTSAPPADEDSDL